jgi:DNA-binding LacI/PurR family transcriptional regulator
MSKKKKKSIKSSITGMNRDFLYKQIANKLREEIDKGLYVPGSRLPSMDILATHFDVNKITVLKAMDELKSEGVIYSIPAKGTYVTEVKRTPREERNHQRNGESKGKKNLTFGLLSQVLSPEAFGPYHLSIISGVQEELGRKKGNLMLMPAGDTHTDAELYRMAMEADVDAIIYLGSFHNGLLNRLINDGVSSVVVDHAFKGCSTDSTIVDNTGGGYLIMNHLLNLGHRNITLITGSENQKATMERIEGISQALSNNRLTLNDITIIPGDFTRKSGFDGAMKILKENKDCTAICCMNDEMAAGVLQAIYSSSDLKVPHDISVTGFDDVQLSAITHPPLTSVHVDMRHMGRIAVQRLIDRMEDPDSSPSSTLISTQLIVRDSTSAPIK